MFRRLELLSVEGTVLIIEMLKLFLLKGNQYENSVLTNTDCFRKHR